MQFSEIFMAIILKTFREQIWREKKQQGELHTKTNDRKEW